MTVLPRPSLTDAQRLMVVRAAHSAIYLVMASAVFVMLFAGVTGAHGWWLWGASGLVGVECIVFAVSGMKCPLTAIAVRYGATKTGGYDTFLPERLTRYTLRLFGPLIVLGLALLVWQAVRS